jgi:hypothetical protein
LFWQIMNAGTTAYTHSLAPMVHATFYNRLSSFINSILFNPCQACYLKTQRYINVSTLKEYNDSFINIRFFRLHNE